MMKVTILTEASHEVGFGHLTRCIALYQGFEEKKIYSEIVVQGDSTIDYLLKNIKNKKIDWLRQNKEIIASIKNVGILIIDSYSPDLDFYKSISSKVKLPVYLDDFIRLNYPKGIVINPSIYGDKLRYPKNKNIKYLLGKDYIILRKEFWNIHRKRINQKIKNVLITLGGMEHNLFIKKLIEFLKKKFNYNICVIKPEDKLTISQTIRLLLKCDVAISGGGQTTYELARCGLSIIGVCFADNQLLNLKYGEEAGYLKFAGWFEDDNLFNKIETILKHMDYISRNKMSTIGYKLVNGQGVKKILNEILK